MAAPNPAWEASFAAAQQHPAFCEWVAAADDQVEYFLDMDVAGMPADPFTAEGLQKAEEQLLEDFPAQESIFEDQDSQDLFDRYARFLGTCFVRKLSGTWVDMPAWEGSDAFLGVQLPTSNTPLRIYQLVQVAISRRTGRVWAPVFGYAEEDARNGHRPGTPRS